MWHLTYSPIVTFTVCSVIRGAVFQGSHGDITTTLMSEHTTENVLCGNGLSAGSTELETADSFPSLRFRHSTCASSITSAASYLNSMI